MRYLFLIGLLLASARLAARQHPLPLVTYSITEKDGLCDNNINCFFQDHRGVMWMGTGYGLNSIDGSAVRAYHTGKPGKGLSNDAVNDITEDDQQVLWLATGYGLDAYDLRTGRFSHYFVPDVTESSNRFYSLCLYGQYLFIGTEYGLLRFDRATHQFVSYNNKMGNAQDNHISKLFADSKKRIWVGSFNGLWLFDPAKQSFSLQNNSTGELITDIYEDHNGNIWAGTWDKGLKKLDEVTHTFIPSLHFSNSSTNVTSITELQDTKGNYHLWCGPGPFILDSSNHSFGMVTPGKKNDREPVTCTRLYTDRNKLLWMGTSEGVKIYDPARQYFRTYVLSGYVPLTSQGISLYPLNGRFLLGAEGSNALGLYNDTLKVLRNLSSLVPSAAAVMNIYRDRQGDTWLCTSQGLVQLDSSLRQKKVYRYNDDDPISLPKNFLNCFIERSNGEKWVMPWRKGIWRLDATSGRFSRIILASGDTLLPNANISKAMEDADGNTWFTDYFNGLYRLDARNETLQPITGNMRLTNMVMDDRNMWTVSAQTIYCTDTRSGKTRQWPLPEGKNKYEYDCIMGDGGWLWIATRTGLLAFHTDKHIFKSYTEEDGLFTDNMDVTFTRLSNGNILCAGNTYATVFSPGIIDHTQPAPALIFTGASTDDEEKIISNDHISIAWNEHNTRLTWALVNLSSPLANQYYCKMEGIDKEWHSTGHKGEMVYNNLPEGSYTFYYRAATSDGLESEVRSIHIDVFPPFWKKAWFLALVILFASVLFYFIVRYISQRNLKEKLLRLEKEQAIEKERNRISRDMHDELGSGLTKIAILSEVVKQQGGTDRQSVDKISDTARGLIDNLDEMVWALNPRNDSLDKLIAYISEYAHQFLEGTGINCEVNLPPDIPQDPVGEEKRRHIFMAVKEFLNNSVKHSGTNNISITLAIREKEFELLLQDEGKGFDTSLITGLGNGIKNMAQRITEAGGRTALHSQEGKGTSLRIVFDR